MSFFLVAGSRGTTTSSAFLYAEEWTFNTFYSADASWMYVGIELDFLPRFFFQRDPIQKY